ncbi:MAG: hypothetical protein HY347_04760 [candidate division NC10 bacterium]|nr:hypothetical protein [candidate division NC10 bacterium]
MRDEQPTLAAATFQAKVRQLEAKLDALITEERWFTDPDNARVAKRLRKQRRHLLTFLQAAMEFPGPGKAVRPLLLPQKRPQDHIPLPLCREKG